MPIEPDTKAEAEAESDRRGRGRPSGRRDAKPRELRRSTPESIIRAAGAAGFVHCSIDTDGKITVQMIPPADQAGEAGCGAGDDKGDDKQWDAKAQQWRDRAGQD